MSAATSTNPLSRAVSGFRIERRAEPKRIGLYRVVSVAIGLTLALVIAPFISGVSASLFYETVWMGTLGSPIGLGNFLTVATPLVIAGLAVAVPMKLKLWNIGVDGQILMGAWCATGIAFTLGSLPGAVLIPLMFLGGLFGGALWMLIPALSRVYLGVNEILTTFLLNFVATAWLLYWVTGAWLDPSSGGGGIRSRKVPEQAELTLLNFDGITVHWGIIIAIALPIAIWATMRFTRAGYELTIAGSGEKVGRFAGLNVKRKQLGAMLVGGALAGLAGTIDMLGTIHQYGEGLTNNRGFAAVVIAVLAGASPIGVLLMGIVYALLLAGSDAVSVIGVSNELVYGLIGLTLFTGAMGEAIARLRLVRTRKPAVSSDQERTV